MDKAQRGAFTQGLKRRREMLQRLVPGREAARRRQAVARMAGLVGAIILSAPSTIHAVRRDPRCRDGDVDATVI